MNINRLLLPLCLTASLFPAASAHADYIKGYFNFDFELCDEGIYFPPTCNVPSTPLVGGLKFRSPTYSPAALDRENESIPEDWDTFDEYGDAIGSVFNVSLVSYSSGIVNLDGDELETHLIMSLGTTVGRMTLSFFDDIIYIDAWKPFQFCGGCGPEDIVLVNDIDYRFSVVPAPAPLALLSLGALLLLGTRRRRRFSRSRPRIG